MPSPGTMSPRSSIAHYRITAKLGEGGMGEVWRATDTKLNREVAIKVLPESYAQDADRMARFAREAQVLASLNHPNIAAIYGVEERALVLELVEGPTLADRIAQGAIPIDEALPIARQIAEALEYAHEKGVIHRDLKPANVKVTPEGRVKVLDFGLAKALIGEASAAGPSSPTLTMRATQLGVIMGTAAYMSPEQAKGKPVDRRADIWSFGILLAEMLTGHPVYTGETVSEVLAAVLLKDPPIPGDLPFLRQLLRRCLDRDPAQRLQAIGEARIALANPAAAVEPAPVPARRPGRLPWVVAAAATAAALGFAAVLLQRPLEEPRNVRFSIATPEKMTFETNQIALSPDGRRLVFGAYQDGVLKLWVRDLDSAASRPLPGTEGTTNATSGFWSPDGKYLGFFQGGKLKKIDISGGQPVTVCDAVNARGGSWSTRDIIVFANTTTGGLMRVPAAGGIPAPATELDPANETGHRWPWFLPDGRHFLFYSRGVSPDKSALWLGDLDSKDRRRVVTTTFNGAYDPRGLLLFVRQGTLMAQPWDPVRAAPTGDTFPVVEHIHATPNNSEAHFAISRAGTLAWFSGAATGITRLTWFDRDGKPLGAMGPVGQIYAGAISPDGATVVSDRLDPLVSTADLWLHDLKQDTDSRFTFDPSDEVWPVWSPDGSRIAFQSYRSGKFGIWVKPASGSGTEELLLEWPGAINLTDWSRDGNFLVFTSLGPQNPGIFVISDPLDAAKRKVSPFLQTGSAERDGRISPDGKWMAFTSEETRTPQVYVVSFPGKEAKFQVSRENGTRPFWRRDGKELFFMAGVSLMAVELKGGTGFDRTTPRLLFQTSAITSAIPDISPDGKRFLIPTVGVESNGEIQLNVSTNWRAGVQK